MRRRRGPDADQRLLLRAAVIGGENGRSAWDEWRRAGGNIDTLDPSAARLLPAVYRNLSAGAQEDPDLPRLRGVYRHAWALNQRTAQLVRSVLESLRRAGVETMLLKGAALRAAHYRDAGARRIDDAGVLVPPPDTSRALEVLRESGWSPRCRIDPGRVLRSRHAMPLAEPGGGRIDLHWRVLPESVRDDDFWAGAVPAEMGGAATLVPGPAEQLLHACVYGGRSGAAAWIADAAVIVRSAGDGIDWRRLVDGAARRDIALTVRTSLDMVREVLGAPIPDRVPAELAALPSTRRERLVLRLDSSPTLVASSARLWDLYRRRAAAGGEVHEDFLQYVADAADLPSRRAVAARAALRAVGR